MAKQAEYANDLESATAKQILAVDTRGNVISRRARRLRSFAYHGILAGLIGVEGLAGYALYGVAGLSIAAVLGALVSWRLRLNAKRGEGVRAIAAFDLDAAERIFSAIQKRRLLPRRWRAHTYDWLAQCAMLRGDAALALERTREALRRRGSRPGLYNTLARMREVNCLVRLGRLEEARTCFDALGPEPAGEVPALARYTCELFLAFAEGRHTLSDETLHERAQFALGVTLSTPLLTGLAWAFERLGDEDMAELLASEARDRATPGFAKALPELAEWLDARGETGPRVRVETEDELRDELALEAELVTEETRRRAAR